jgi:hypothetical protein
MGIPSLHTTRSDLHINHEHGKLFFTSWSMFFRWWMTMMIETCQSFITWRH